MLSTWVCLINYFSCLKTKSVQISNVKFDEKTFKQFHA